MKVLLATVCALAVAAGAAFADEPLVSFGPTSAPHNDGGQRDEFCQYGFQDDGIGWGWTLGYGQSLGIDCPGPICIDLVGFYIEFFGTYGQLDILIYDGGTLVSTTRVTPAVGDNNFPIDPPVNVGGTACIMLCPVGQYHSVLGEDYTNGPFGHSYWSQNCTCQNVFTDNNLTVWARLCAPSATEDVSWGAVRTLYR